MALVTGYVCMSTGKREFAVIKAGAVPARSVVTSRTVGSELTVMLIILFMAGITIGGRAFEDVIDVALLAFHFGVPALQFEGGKVMVKSGFLPIRWIVAGTAIRAKLSVMGIVSGVTGSAILGCSRKIGQCARIHVTFQAGHLGMFAFQLESEPRMAKGFTKSVHSVVTGKAGRPIGLDMRLGENNVNLTVATVAGV